MKKLLSFLFLLTMSNISFSQNSNISNKDCSKQINEVNQNRMKYVDSIIKNNLHIGMTAHKMFPHYTSQMKDVMNAKKSLVKSDIPILIKMVSQNNITSEKRVLIGNILVQFGQESKECIDSVMELPEYQNNINLSEIKTDIIVEITK